MARLINKSGVLAIMNKRIPVGEQSIGKKVLFTVQGNGTTVDVKNAAGELVQSVVEPGTVFQAVIFNLQANSGLAMKDARHKAESAAGLAAERAGNPEEAHKHFSAFLNGVQMSFNVPTTSPILAKLGDRVDISARVVKITTEKGSLLTIDATTIRVVEPEVLAPVTFSFDEELDETPANAETAKKLLEA